MHNFFITSNEKFRFFLEKYKNSGIFTKKIIDFFCNPPSSPKKKTSKPSLCRAQFVIKAWSTHGLNQCFLSWGNLPILG